MKFKTIFSLFLTPLLSVVGYTQYLEPKVVGDEKSGYYVEIYNNSELLLKSQGEFDLDLSNLDSSVQLDIKEWKASSYKRTSSGIILEKNLYLKQFDANLSTEVIYEKIKRGLIKKTVRLSQNSIPNFYFSLILSSKPAKTPQKYVTFEHKDFPGGMIHELYPSAGFITKQGLVLGFLTNPGYKNNFTRTTRRRFSGRGGGMIGMRILPDLRLLSVANENQQRDGKHFVKYTFGEAIDLNRGSSFKMTLKKPYQPEGKVSLSQNDSLIKMKFSDKGTAGLNVETGMLSQKIYTISFLAKGDMPLAIKLYRFKNGEKGAELEHGIKYIDGFTIEKNTWQEFTGSVMVPYIQGDSIQMFIGRTNGLKGSISLKNLKIERHRPFIENYNRMSMGDTIEKVVYIFSKPWEGHKDFKVASQIKLAEGMGFQGNEIEKMLYANFQMMTWITSVDDEKPFNVPNLNYSPDMYNRDSFWSVISTYNKYLNLSIWNQWAATQNSNGAIGTIITPYMGSVEAKDNEATIEWLIWGLLNKRRFGVELPKDKIKRAADYILNEFDENRDGKCASHFSMSQVDVMEYHPKTERMAANQGMFAVALKTIKELGLEIDEDYVEKAEQEYRNFYDINREHLLFDSNYPDLISLTDLVPEFLSLWLFDEPLLTDEMVQNHLNQIPALNKVENSPYPELGTTAPIIVRLTDDSKGYTYMDREYQPFGQFGHDNYGNNNRDGYYYNGGSWLRAEYMAYSVGYLHGWKPAKKRMQNRLWAEKNLNPNWPYSKEFIPTKWKSFEEWWPSTRGLSWNVFVLMANELIGERTPDMDPDYRKNTEETSLYQPY
ncbi:hypothetical protein DET49_1153 [Salegentibacter sp. 24]|uniref:hypothetical protein n=1 Tax=Salegentibacter sp. 24 TaxID=2183986 RepID=UPI0010D033B0|nr:hypothetical protein [Salegentibacter sp. 24]TDN86343.1 hypothetical protein DET49_1153 [Salegentibacter sp. 24]